MRNVCTHCQGNALSRHLLQGLGSLLPSSKIRAAPMIYQSAIKCNQHAIVAGATDAVVCRHHAQGGAGAVDLAEAVTAACQQPASFDFLYPLDLPLKVSRPARTT